MGKGRQFASSRTDGDIVLPFAPTFPRRDRVYACTSERRGDVRWFARSRRKSTFASPSASAYNLVEMNRGGSAFDAPNRVVVTPRVDAIIARNRSNPVRVASSLRVACFLVFRYLETRVR